MARPDSADTALEAVYLRLLALAKQRGSLCIGLSSASPGEGVTSMAAGLARVAAARTDGRVIVCDLGQGSRRLGSVFGVEAAPAAEAPSHGKLPIVPGPLPRLDILSVAADFSGIGDTERWDHVMAALRQQYQIIILDLGDLGTPVPAAWQHRVDELMLVVDSNHTTYESLARLRKELEDTDITLSGFALNKRRFYVPASVYRFIY